MKEYKLPEVLRKTLKEKGMSYRNLADMMNTSETAVGRWATFNATPNVYSLMNMSEKLGVSIDYLITGEK